MDNKTHIKKIGLAIFKDKKIILGRTYKDTQVFTILGGKVEGNETDFECAKREAQEEMGIAIDSNYFKFLYSVEGPAHGNPDKIVTIDVYEIKPLEAPTPSSEIADLQYFDSTIDPTRLSPLGKEIFMWLKEKGYIN